MQLYTGWIFQGPDPADFDGLLRERHGLRTIAGLRQRFAVAGLQIEPLKKTNVGPIQIFNAFEWKEP